MNDNQIKPDHIYASLYKTKPYTDDPINEAITISQNNFKSSSKLTHDTVSKYIDLQKLCLQQNYISFDNKFNVCNHSVCHLMIV